MPFKLVKEVRDINRFREILTVVFEEGFDFLIDKIRLKHRVPVHKRVRKQKKQHPFEKRLRLALERLGPTFIKFGQVLSVRPDLVPKSYIRELEKLQDAVPPIPFSEVEAQIKKELGHPIKTLFKSVEKKPFASASISQVHKAMLKDGSIVAVKVQRPNVKKLMETDIEIMFYCARLLEKHFSAIRKYNPVQIVEEFRAWTERELDFRREAINARRFARNFSHDRDIKIPRIYKQLTTHKILMTEFIEGTELHNVQKLKKSRYNVKILIEKGFQAILTQVFVHGFFHADPHPGNIIITKDKRIAFVDFGIVGYFDDTLKQRSIELFYGVIENDPKKVVETLLELSETDIAETQELEDEIAEVLESLQDSDLNTVRVSYVLEEVLDIALRFNLKVPMVFVLFGKTVITLEGIALEYDPAFRIVERSKPFIEELLLQKYNPATMVKSAVKSIFRVKKYAEQIPEQTSRALKKIEKGSFRVDIEDSDIKKLSVEIDKSSNRIAYSMLIAALLIMGALTINFGNPVASTLPLLSLVSFAAAFLLALFLIFSILREKHA